MHAYISVLINIFVYLSSTTDKCIGHLSVRCKQVLLFAVTKTPSIVRRSDFLLCKNDWFFYNKAKCKYSNDKISIS